MGSETLRQSAASRSIITAYQIIWITLVLLLALRNATLHLLRRRTSVQQAGLPSAPTFDSEKATLSTLQSPALASRASSWIYNPVSSHPAANLLSPLRILVVTLVFVINLGFVLAIATDIRGKQSMYLNQAHDVVMRCGSMSLANAPSVFAFTGRNSLVSILTETNSQHLRFVHKTFGATLAFLAIVHFLGAIFSSLVWSGPDAVVAMFKVEVVKWGVMILLGVLFMITFSLPVVRRRFYEFFVASHVLGATLILVGGLRHAPELKAFLYVPVGFWVAERLARVFQLVSIPLALTLPLKLRSPVTLGRAKLVNGAIILRVPFPQGSWAPGQHTYIHLADPNLLRQFPQLAIQSHPFSIANSPHQSSSSDTKSSTLEMLSSCASAGA